MGQGLKPYYEKDGVQIFHADCREVLPHLPKVDLVLTDPPYGVLAETGSAATRRSGGNKDDGRIAWDIAPDKAFMARVMAHGKDAAIWGGCHLELPPTTGYLIWDKRIDGLNFGEVEFCWTTARFAPRIWRERAVCVDGGKLHPTQKPRKLMEWCLQFFPNAQTILDPFCGSGTTLVAAKQLNRRAIGIEIEERYCEIAAKRLAQSVFEFDSPNLDRIEAEALAEKEKDGEAA